MGLIKPAVFYDHQAPPPNDRVVLAALAGAIGAGGATTAALQGAADFLGPGAIEMPQMQPEIFDLVRRKYALMERITKTPATGHPSRFVEQTAIGQGAFVDPRNMTATRTAPTRQENPLMLKALSNELTYGQFDLDLSKIQPSIFEKLQAKDLNDMLNGILVVHGKALWTGTDTNLSLPTTTQYVGLNTQITNTFTIAQGASIEDGLKSQVATLMNSTSYDVKPTAIYASPVALDLLDQEMKLLQRFPGPAEVIAGLRVTQLQTQAGPLPLIPEPALQSTVSGGVTSYPVHIVTESAIEYHWLGSEVPRVFQLGLLANLATQYVAVMFGAIVAKGPGYAHAYGQIQR